MRILIVSDLHANLEALRALPREGFDRVFCLGDLVDYGPDPHACVAWAREHASACVCGNHDRAMAFGEDCRCTPAYRRLSETTRAASRARLQPEDFAYLRERPEQVLTEVGGMRFLLTHATVHDPVFGYLAADPPEAWEREIAGAQADVVLTGHTHIAFQRRIGAKLLLNPGSVGQSKMLGGRAYYAVWEDGEARLESAPYDVEEAAAKLSAWREVPADVRDRLTAILRGGGAA